jgi:hypothetical protein
MSTCKGQVEVNGVYQTSGSWAHKVHFAGSTGIGLRVGQLRDRTGTGRVAVKGVYEIVRRKFLLRSTST